MKNFLFTAVCLFSLSSFAQSSGSWQKSTSPDILKKSVIDAINAKTLKCSGSVTDDKGTVSQSELNLEAVKYSVTNATEVFGKGDLSQPLLFFKLEADESGNHYATQVYVNTAADRKSVTTLDLKQKVTTTKVQQTGTIDHPQQQNVTVTLQDITGSCQ